MRTPQPLTRFCTAGRMPVWLKNLQSSVRFGEQLLRLQTNFILGLAGAGRYDVSVVCVESESIRSLNRVYRNVDQATDVLAFPYHEDTLTGVLPAVQEGREEDYNLGDVILGMSVIREECEGEGVRLGNRLPVIFTHGLCHLLGYCHSTPSLAEQMYRREKALLTLFNCSFGTAVAPLTSTNYHLSSKH